MLNFYYDGDESIQTYEAEFTLEIKNDYYKGHGTVDKDSIKTLYTKLIEDGNYDAEFNLIDIEEHEGFTAIKYEATDYIDGSFLLFDLVREVPKDVYTYFICSPSFDFYYKHVGKNSLPFSSRYLVYTAHNGSYILCDDYKETISKLEEIAQRILHEGASFTKDAILISKIDSGDNKDFNDLLDDYKTYDVVRENINFAAKQDNPEEIIKMLRSQFGDDMEIVFIDEETGKRVGGPNKEKKDNKKLS